MRVSTVPTAIEDERLSETFAALASSTRRAILARLAEGAATVSELASPFSLSLPAVSKHIKVLEERCEAGETIDAASLAKLGVIRDTGLPLKVLGEGDLSKKLEVKAAKFSASARQKIEAAGGTVIEG